MNKKFSFNSLFGNSSAGETRQPKLDMKEFTAPGSKVTVRMIETDGEIEVALSGRVERSGNRIPGSALAMSAAQAIFEPHEKPAAEALYASIETTLKNKPETADDDEVFETAAHLFPQEQE